MSTRCTVTVRDEYSAFTIYRHSDGYPLTKHGVIETLGEALPYAWELPRFEAADFAAAIVAAWKKPGGYIQGGYIYLTTNRDDHGDTDYHYEVTAKDGRVRVTTYASRWADDDTRTWRKVGKSATVKPISEAIAA